MTVTLGFASSPFHYLFPNLSKLFRREKNHNSYRNVPHRSELSKSAQFLSNLDVNARTRLILFTRSSSCSMHIMVILLKYESSKLLIINLCLSESLTGRLSIVCRINQSNNKIAVTPFLFKKQQKSINIDMTVSRTLLARHQQQMDSVNSSKLLLQRTQFT